eukprot:2102143-Amphidinium_carterae.1
MFASVMNTMRRPDVAEATRVCSLTTITMEPLAHPSVHLIGSPPDSRMHGNNRLVYLLNCVCCHAMHPELHCNKDLVR